MSKIQPIVNGELAAKRIVQARTILLLEEPFFGSLALRLKMIPNPRIPTFRTDGQSIEYNPAYAEARTQAELQFLMCHEVLHVANGHCWRRGNREIRRWRHATDYSINPIAVNAGMKMPEGGLLDPAFKGKAAEQVYQLLPSMPDQSQGQPGDGAGEPGEDHGGCCGVQDAPGDASQQEEARGEWEAAVMQAAQAAKAQGKLPAGLERLVDQIKQSRVDWRAVLRRFVQENCRDDYSWARPAARFIPSGLYMPSLRSESMAAIAIYWDTSGSRDTDEARQECAAELSAIVDEVRPERSILIYGDSKVQRVDIFERDEPIEFRPKGGGGTDFRCIFSHIQKAGYDIACFVGITDLCGSFPDSAPDYPVIWAATTDIDPPFGECIRIVKVS